MCLTKISVAMLAAGAKSNRLPVELQRLSVYLSTTAKIARELGSATAPRGHPGDRLARVLVGLAVAASAVEPFLRGLPEQEWPVATHWAIHVSNGARSILPVVLVAAALAYAGLRILLRGEKGQLLRDGMLLQAPLLVHCGGQGSGSLHPHHWVLVAAGIPLLNAMESAAMTAGNVAVRGAVLLAMDKLSKGRDLSTALAEVDWFREPRSTPCKRPSGAEPWARCC